MSCHILLQGIFPTQGSNPGHLHCRQILYHLSQQGSPQYHIGAIIFQGTSNSLLQGLIQKLFELMIFINQIVVNVFVEIC